VICANLSLLANVVVLEVPYVGICLALHIQMRLGLHGDPREESK